MGPFESIPALDATRPRGKREIRPASLEAGESWHGRRILLQSYPKGRVGRFNPTLALPEADTYHIKINISVISPDDHASIPVGPYSSNPLEIRVIEPKGENLTVFEAMSDVSSRTFLELGWHEPQGLETAFRLSKILSEHPKNDYRDAIRRPLRALYRHQIRGGGWDDPDRQMIRIVLGEPDDRIGPDDLRLDRGYAFDFPEPTPMRSVLDALQKRTGVTLDASPYFLRDRGKLRVSRARRGHCASRCSCFTTGGRASWAPRGDGYYLYAEMYGGEKFRESYREALGPAKSPFPDDHRLEVKVIADFPEPTTIDIALADYTKQTGVPLGASAFLHRCQQSGERMTLDLGEEMGYLARTFRAEWKRRDDGYYLDAGAEADRVELPPEAVRPPGLKPDEGGIGGLFTLGVAGLLGIAALGWAHARRRASLSAARATVQA